MEGIGDLICIQCIIFLFSLVHDFESKYFFLLIVGSFFILKNPRIFLIDLQTKKIDSFLCWRWEGWIDFPEFHWISILWRKWIFLLKNLSIFMAFLEFPFFFNDLGYFLKPNSFHFWTKIPPKLGVPIPLIAPKNLNSLQHLETF